MRPHRIAISSALTLNLESMWVTLKNALTIAYPGEKEQSEVRRCAVDIERVVHEICPGTRIGKVHLLDLVLA